MLQRVDQANHFREYDPSERDEAFGADGVSDQYKAIVEALNNCSAHELKSRQQRLDRAAAELGIQFALPGERIRDGIDWKLDLFPRVISPEDWDLISRGVIQRAEAFNAYISDIYHEQKILSERVIPFELPLRDPAFHRSFSGIESHDNRYCLTGAFDLVRMPDGEWQVLENQLATPIGVSYILQNRRLLAQAFPELFATMNVAPVASFSTYLAEALRAQTDVSNPNIVLLTRGETSQTLFEEGFLARHMGISVVRPADLLVRDSYVYLKTIRGLERIDVIYRRIESATVDPVATPSSGAFEGVPGLVNVLRKGNVSIVNALGAGVADNRAILRYSDRIIGYYSGRRAILPTAPTYHLSDHDQRSFVAENMDSMLLKPVQDHASLRKRLGWKGQLDTPADIARLAKHHPEYCIAQPIISPSQLPRFSGGEFSPHTVFMRAFFILGDEPVVLPGGLTRQTSRHHRSGRLSINAEGMKDTWAPAEAVIDRDAPTTPTITGERISIGSRTAESLYWAGRYLSRAENTARQFNTLENLRWDQLGLMDQQAYWPLLQAVAAATGQQKYAKRKRPPRDTLKFSTQLVLDPNESASVSACVLSAQFNLGAVRGAISPECWQTLRELVIYLNNQSRARISRSQLREVSDRVVSEAARFQGLAERTMLHDDAWQFYRIGGFLERALGVLYLLEVALPRAAELYRIDDEESTDLTALLRLNASLDAYRREYRSRAYLDRVARLLLLSPNNPSSVNFCLRNVRYALGTLSISGERDVGEGVVANFDALIDYLEALPITQMFPSPVPGLDAGGTEEAEEHPRVHPEYIKKQLTALTKEVEQIHENLEDVFFSHQFVYARSPTLFES
ncbi:circularly permuted type 2 ATP-grasp protein [Cerasicoccus fimbriatus]|uniref:circularly permuted type 2 ATP-grasp protein n=1 Tax=Cerasicoccus fimbriatus TaxID=3014554 RepID=UPI0022B45297|nr:circularly permuted type 2 ATP-grasp protein [Cerasicoccus sp. TK19100]